MFFLKGNSDYLCLVCMPNVAKCADDLQVLELLQKCFVRIKTVLKKITAISHENRAKN